MECGYRSDAELKAVFDYSIWVAKAMIAHNDDDDFKKFGKTIMLKCLQMLNYQKSNSRNWDIIASRNADCEGCKFTCDNRSYCKWFSGKQKVEFVRENFGELAIDYLKKYGRA